MGKADERRSTRHNVLLLASTATEGGATRVKITNLSAHGALIVGDPLPPLESPVVLHCHGHAIGSRVVWARPPYAGLQFDEPINPEDVLPQAHARSKVITKDNRNLSFRRPGLRGDQLTAEEKIILEEWTRARDAGLRPPGGRS